MALEGGRASPREKSGDLAQELWHRLPQRARRPLSSLAKLADKRLQGRIAPADAVFGQSNDAVGGIRINLAGREANGLVPTDEMDGYCNWLIEALRAVRIVDSGEPLVADIFRARDRYAGRILTGCPTFSSSGTRHRASAPDLCRHWHCTTGPTTGLERHPQPKIDGCGSICPDTARGACRPLPACWTSHRPWRGFAAPALDCEGVTADRRRRLTRPGLPGQRAPERHR